MNSQTTLKITLQQYFSFVNDLNDFEEDKSVPASSEFAKLIIDLAASHPTIYSELTWTKRHQLRCHKNDSALLVVGNPTIASLKKILSLDSDDLSLAARGLLEEYSHLDKAQKEVLYKRIDED
ncbi:MAG: hypothetical protein LKF75_04930 [Bacilli bacterium]|jgi:hypothetical protein|nr:hypothetical protein [Bacilli bacterium]MCH4229018.1 hypothetical protein [Bacilli bacterium]